MALCRPHLQVATQQVRRAETVPTHLSCRPGKTRCARVTILAGSGPEEACLNAQDPVVKLYHRTHEGTHLRFLQSRSIGALHHRVCSRLKDESQEPFVVLPQIDQEPFVVLRTFENSPRNCNFAALCNFPALGICSHSCTFAGSVISSHSCISPLSGISSHLEFLPTCNSFPHV